MSATAVGFLFMVMGGILMYFTDESQPPATVGAVLLVLGVVLFTLGMTVWLWQVAP